MAKRDLFKEAQAAGRVPEDAVEDDYTVAQLEALLGRGDVAAFSGSSSAGESLVAPDGHVLLTQEDFDARG